MEGKPVLERKLTDEEIAKYLWNTFKFSQGLPNVQKMILRYISFFTGPQKMTGERKKNILAIFAGMTGTISQTYFAPAKLEKRGQHGQVIFREDRKGNPAFWFQMNAYLWRLNRNTSRIHEQVLKRTILLSLLYLDYKYLIIMGNRPRGFDVKREEDNLFKDEYFSFIVHYLIRGNPTGIPELDTMFARMKKYYCKEAFYLTKKPNDFFFTRIIKAYNDKHTNKVTDEELAEFYTCKQ